MDTTWLGTKYAILGREADAQMMRARAESALNTQQGRYLSAQTQAYGPEAAARIAQMRAGAGLTSAQTGLTSEQTQMLPLSTMAGVGLTAAQAEAARAQATLTGAMAGWDPNSFAGGTAAVPAKPTTSAKNPKQTVEARSGKDKVPGKGSGKVDTQHAMLAPGEAVLNKAAAEYLGRATIDVLNHVGRIKMGLDTTNPAGDSSTHQQAVKPGKGQPSMPNEAGGEGMGFAGGGMFGPWGDARTMNAPLTPGGSVIGGSPNDPNSMMHARPGIDFIAAGGMTDTSFVPKPPIPGRPGGGGELLPGFAEGIPSVPAPGQTLTNGTWGQPAGNSGDSALRAALGLGMAPRIVGQPTQPPAKPGGLRGLLGFAGGATTVPDARGTVTRKGGKDPSVPQPGSDVLDRWNTGLPMFATGISKVPAKGKSPNPPKGKGKGAGLTPGLVAALLGQGIGSPPAGIPGLPPGLGPSMQPPAIGMGR